MADFLVTLAALGFMLVCGAGLAPTRKVRWAVGIPGILMVAAFVGLAVRQAAGNLPGGVQ